MRGFMLDSARALESRAYYRKMIGFMAAHGCDTLLWHFTDDHGCTLKFDTLPEAASPNAYSKNEMRELIDYAREKNIRVIPELASLGHSRYITHARPDLNDLAESNDLFTSLCPVDPRTRQILGALLDEVCDLFDDKLVHVGLDEVKFGEHPLTQEALKTRSASDLFTDHILFLHDHLTHNGRRMMMWGDHLLRSPEIAAAIPRNILVANWQYDPNFSEETTTTLQNAGFEVVSCPALISAYQFPFPGKKYALPNLEKTARHAVAQQTQGVITTIWLPQRYMSGALWASVHYTAELMNTGGEVALPESLGRFAESFHGMAASDRWIDAMMQMFEHAPVRQPWIAALEMRLDAELDGINLVEQARIWHKI